MLDCPHCETGCPECILRGDLQFEAGKLARKAALELLQKEILPRMALPEELRVLGPDTYAACPDAGKRRRFPFSLLFRAGRLAMTRRFCMKTGRMTASAKR